MFGYKNAKDETKSQLFQSRRRLLLQHLEAQYENGQKKNPRFSSGESTLFRHMKFVSI